MPERPIRAAVQALTSLRAAAGAELDALRAATAGRVDVVGRAAAGPAVAGVARSLAELAELARPMAAVVDAAAESALRAVDAEVAHLLALLHDTPQTEVFSR